MKQYLCTFFHKKQSSFVVYNKKSFTFTAMTRYIINLSALETSTNNTNLATTSVSQDSTVALQSFSQQVSMHDYSVSYECCL